MVANLGDGSNETYNSIRVGWMVITDPHLHSNVSHLEKDFIYYNKLFDIWKTTTKMSLPCTETMFMNRGTYAISINSFIPPSQISHSTHFFKKT